MTCTKYLTLIPSASCPPTMLNYTQKSLPTATTQDSRKTSRQLTISAQRCFILHLGTQIISNYTLNDSVIHAPASVKDLWVTIDKNLKLNMHNNIAHHAHAINNALDHVTAPHRFVLSQRMFVPCWNTHHLFGPCNLPVS